MRKVTVIIPTRDRPDRLNRALLSVVAQTYPNLEIVVVDDASSPPVALATNFNDDDRISTIRLDVSRGPAGARNLGIQKATGELIAFLDDDDEFTPKRIEEAVTVLDAASEDVAAVESGHSGWFDAELVYEYVPSRRRNLKMSLLREPTIALPTLMMKAGAFNNIGLFDETLDRYEDWDLWLRLTDVYGVITLDAIHVRRRLHHPVPARVRLRLYWAMLRRIAPRIRALPFREQVPLWAWHGRFTAYRLLEVLIERTAGQELLQRWKIRRLARSDS